MKKYLIVWGEGYEMKRANVFYNHEVHPLSWFTSDRGFCKEDLVKISELRLAESTRMDDLCIVTVVRIK